MDPDPWTLRELLAMSEGADRARWAQTSAILCLIYNVNRDPKKGGAKRPADFDPWKAGKTRGVSIRSLKDRLMQ